jgi:S-adenosylmethionine:tRNA ribosyltransferase-isomerase
MQEATGAGPAPRGARRAAPHEALHGARTMDAFDYVLPAEAVAQAPAEPRESARLLDATGPLVRHRLVSDLPGLLGPGDLLVVNDTRVVPARILARKRTGATVEVLLLDSLGPGRWEALVRPGRKVPPGAVLALEGREALEVGARRGDRGEREVRILDPDAVARHAEVALPPYVRSGLDDPSRYQTVYARTPGSVAAPTAGLHFSEGLLERCRAAGASVAAVELRIGMATFSPVRTERPEDHTMHSEQYSVPPGTLEACSRASRVVAVGTTTVRALESAALTGELSGRTSLFIHGEFDFRVVDVLMTNFHLPRSSLLLMLDAFCGPRWRSLYEEALGSGYRFLSFGDAMIVGRRDRGGGTGAARPSGPRP